MDFIATLPGWAISGIALGLFGGVAGLIGALLTRAGMSWGKFVPVVGIVIALALSSNGRLTDWVRSATLTPERAGAMLKQQNPELYGFIETNFPNDYSILTTRIADAVRAGGSNSAIGMQGAEAMTEIRRKYAPMVGLASDAEHAALVDSSIELYEALLATDPMLCNAVAVQGPTVLLQRTGTDHIKAMIQPQAIMVLQAAANAMKTPVQRRAVTDADWEEVGNGMYELGATDAQLNAINSLDTTSPALCPGLLILLRTLNGVDTEGMRTVRAQYLADLAAA